MAFKNCTVEIGELGQYLNNVNQYLNNKAIWGRRNLIKMKIGQKAIEDMWVILHLSSTNISSKSYDSDTANDSNLDIKPFIEQV